MEDKKQTEVAVQEEKKPAEHKGNNKITDYSLGIFGTSDNCSMATQMEGKAGVLESEIKMDKGRGASTEKKEEELADLQAKAQAATAAQVSTLADVNKKMEEAAKADQKVSKTEDKDKSKKKNADDKIDEDKKSEATGENQDITVDTNDSVSEETVDVIPDGVNISTSEPVGHNVDVKL